MTSEPESDSDKRFDGTYSGSKEANPRNSGDRVVCNCLRRSGKTARTPGRFFKRRACVLVSLAEKPWKTVV
nr:hypothetical protein Itr_chr08CG07600 [Ipomoea trifida]